jgi:hypothetical protein
MPVEDIVRDLNMFLRGWAGYFRYGSSARVLGQIRNFALTRPAIWMPKKGNRRRGTDRHAPAPASRRRQLDPGSRIAGEPALADRCVQRCPQRRSNPGLSTAVHRSNLDDFR